MPSCRADAHTFPWKGSYLWCVLTLHLILWSWSLLIWAGSGKRDHNRNANIPSLLAEERLCDVWWFNAWKGCNGLRLTIQPLMNWLTPLFGFWENYTAAMGHPWTYHASYTSVGVLSCVVTKGKHCQQQHPELLALHEQVSWVMFWGNETVTANMFCRRHDCGWIRCSVGILKICYKCKYFCEYICGECISKLFRQHICFPPK